MSDNVAEKSRIVERAVSQIEKDFGKGSVFRLGDRPVEDWPVISTSSLLLDHATGIGGFPRGRIVEIYGPESSGKTTLALHAIAEAQKAGGVAAFVDAEHALDPIYAKKLGVDIDNLLFSQPDNGEQALSIVETFVRTSAIDIIVVDSVAALTPRAEIEGDMGDSHMGLHARLMSQALRKLAGIISSTKTTVIFINQIRMKIGVMFGNPEVTTGGNALKFYSSMRIDVRKGSAIKNGAGETIGNETTIKIIKNKMAPPLRVAKTEIHYGRGIAAEKEILIAAVDANILEKSGSWYSYNGQRLGQGLPVVMSYFQDNPQLLSEIKDKVIEALSKSNELVVSTTAESSESEPID